ncbi:metalloendoproteinase 1-like isoform X2 [Andrographis paniculata]|nr:metalloendoproteinase 1-like isoform X2 [Andrographis paniculata]
MIGAQKGDHVPGLSRLKNYLSNLGYAKTVKTEIETDIADDPGTNHFDDQLESALKSYQSFFRLPVTGILDPHTVRKLKEPRCSVPDLTHDTNSSTNTGRFEIPILPERSAVAGDEDGADVLVPGGDAGGRGGAHPSGDGRMGEGLAIHVRLHVGLRQRRHQD